MSLFTAIILTVPVNLLWMSNFDFHLLFRSAVAMPNNSYDTSQFHPENISKRAFIDEKPKVLQRRISPTKN